MESNPPKLKPKTTWLEIAIGVVLLLGLSMSVVPQLSRAAGEGRIAQLSDRLHVIRCTLDLYKAEHNGLLPGQDGSGQAVVPDRFIRDITMPSSDGQFRYFRTFPENPFVGQAECRRTVTCTNEPNSRPDGTEGTAWWFNSATGDFRACDSKFHTAY